jgi:hypothetical protein
MTRKEQIEMRLEGLEANLEMLNKRVEEGDGSLAIIDEIRETVMLIDELEHEYYGQLKSEYSEIVQ